MTSRPMTLPEIRCLLLSVGLHPDRRPHHFRVGDRVRRAGGVAEPARVVTHIHRHCLHLEGGRRLNVAAAVPVR